MAVLLVLVMLAVVGAAVGQLDPLADVVPHFDNASIWHNLTIWTAQHLAFLNMTRLTPSLDDIVAAGPRMVMKLGRLGAFIPLPNALDGLGFHQRVLPAATDAAGHAVFQGVSAFPAAGSTMAAAVSAVSAASAAASAAAAAAAEQDASGSFSASASLLSSESVRGLGSLLSYATSKWAFSCVAISVILNRTYIFAATRRRVRLPWSVRLALRALPIALFLLQTRRLLQSIQCQTSPDFAQLRWGDPTKHSDLLFIENSPLLHALSSRLLFNPTDRASCTAVRMIPSTPADDSSAPAYTMRGSLSLLWPLFLSFCFSHFVETLSCAVQGRPVAAETGMTVFEHSLAFAEADAAISNQLGWGSFFSSSTASASAASHYAFARTSTLAAVVTAVTNAAVAAAAEAEASGAGAGTSGGAGAGVPITRAMILKRVNTPPEVLLLAFLSAMSHLSSHVLGVLNWQAKFRLVSTGFWALCFMSSIVWSILTFSLDDPAGQSLLRFPTVAIVGFIPHMLVLVGIVVCCFIYGTAILLAAASQEPDVVNGNGNGRLTYRERLAHAHANMQANLPMGSLRISMEMDFYTALLRVGFDAITMASEAVYLNEDRRVNLRPHTWLEDERYNELQELRSRWHGLDLPGSHFDAMGATGLVPISGVSGMSGVSRMSGMASGYSRERTAQKATAGKNGDRVRPIRAGVGAAERSGRWVMAAEYLIHVGKLLLSFCAVHLCRGLAAVGIRSQPRWLRRLVQRRKASRSADDDGDERNGDDGSSTSDSSDNEDRLVWKEEGVEGQTASLPIQRRGQVDVEHEMRRRFTAIRAGGDLSGSARRDEQEMDSKLYQWWLKGGWWGDVDNSGDYEPSIASDDDDATSVISAPDEDPSESGWESLDEEENDDRDNMDGYGSGQRTPTQRSPMATRESTPAGDMTMGMHDMARLLDPRSPEERSEAQALAAHLQSEGILTRAAFAQFRQRQRVELLATSRFNNGAQRLAAFRPGARLSPEEEAQLLEQILMSRRAPVHSDYSHGYSHSHGLNHNDNHDATIASSAPASSWATGAAGLGPDGPQCVVCQSAPRTIIVWPCRCLSLCDDCRVSLAMNNFDKCVCCRREVASFSRIYVP